jgi:hypothetical protein
VVSHAAAEEAIELADFYGVAGGHPLDESQRFTLRAALGERADGTWAASTVADFEPRQNGKNDTIAARELFGLILGGEKLIIHTAHEFSTANESFMRLVAVFENHDDLRSKVSKIRYANGEQAIILLNGARIKYRARTGGSGRGFAKTDLTVYDEAQHVHAEHIAASGPARLANPNSQSWYAGSGGFATSKNAWRLRRRALEGNAGRLAYVEHTAEAVTLSDGAIRSVAPEDVLDREAWARANPAYGWRITDEAMFDLYGELGPDLFARECLCLWEQELDAGARVIATDAWEAVKDRQVQLDGKVVFGFDVAPDRSRAAVAVSDGGAVELVDARAGVGWVVDRLVELSSAHHASVALDPTAAAGAFQRELVDRQVKVVEVGGRQFVQACGSFYDRVMERTIKVRPTRQELDAAAASAVRRNVGDAWVWGRRSSDTDISPLVAVTLAAWAAGASPTRVPMASWA